MKIESFFDSTTFTLTYIVWDPETRDAVVIDPVMDYDPAASAYSYESIEKLWTFISGKELHVHLILETHAHADHLSGGQELKSRIPKSQIGIGEGIIKVQETFKDVFNLKNDFVADGRQFDRLFSDGEVFSAGSLEFQAIHTPGHTEACYSYMIKDTVFTGDALFMPDFGVGRCDFPKGSAKKLYNSVTQKLYTLPDETQFFTGHDYQPGGRALKYQSTIGESKKSNIQLKSHTTEDEFIQFRTERDLQLSVPRLLLPSIAVNINGGHLPKPEDNGVSYLKIPVSLKNE